MASSSESDIFKKICNQLLVPDELVQSVANYYYAFCESEIIDYDFDDYYSAGEEEEVSIQYRSKRFIRALFIE